MTAEAMQVTGKQNTDAQGVGAYVEGESLEDLEARMTVPTGPEDFTIVLDKTKKGPFDTVRDNIALWIAKIFQKNDERRTDLMKAMKLELQIKELKDQIDAAFEEMGPDSELTEKIAELRARLKELTGQLASIDADIARAQQDLEEAERRYGKDSQEYALAQNKLNTLKKRKKQIEQEIATTQAEIDQIGGEQLGQMMVQMMQMMMKLGEFGGLVRDQQETGYGDFFDQKDGITNDEQYLFTQEMDRLKRMNEANLSALSGRNEVGDYIARSV